MVGGSFVFICFTVAGCFFITSFKLLSNLFRIYQRSTCFCRAMNCVINCILRSFFKAFSHTFTITVCCNFRCYVVRASYRILGIRLTFKGNGMCCSTNYNWLIIDNIHIHCNTCSICCKCQSCFSALAKVSERFQIGYHNIACIYSISILIQSHYGRMLQGLCFVQSRQICSIDGKVICTNHCFSTSCTRCSSCTNFILRNRRQLHIFCNHSSAVDIFCSAYLLPCQELFTLRLSLLSIMCKFLSRKLLFVRHFFCADYFTRLIFKRYHMQNIKYDIHLSIILNNLSIVLNVSQCINNTAILFYFGRNIFAICFKRL